jgi:hypothetical protein
LPKKTHLKSTSQRTSEIPEERYTVHGETNGAFS